MYLRLFVPCCCTVVCSNRNLFPVTRALLAFRLRVQRMWYLEFARNARVICALLLHSCSIRNLRALARLVLRAVCGTRRFACCSTRELIDELRVVGCAAFPRSALVLCLDHSVAQGFLIRGS